MAKRDIRQEVTDSIVAALEAGTRPWQQSWQGTGMRFPLKHDGEPYRGINVLMLWAQAQLTGYQQRRWLTFKQARALGGSVRKGEKGSISVFYNTYTKEVDGEEKTFRVLRHYTVFNIEQCDGLPEEMFECFKPHNPDNAPIDNAERFFRGTGSVVKTGGDRAFYRPGADLIRMPELGQFNSSEAYYAVLAHEHVHWTGAQKRLNRKGISEFDGFGTPQYAEEELIAELGSAFLCAELGLAETPREDHASYIGGWLKKLENDKGFIFKAAAQAQKAVDYLHELQG